MGCQDKKWVCDVCGEMIEDVEKGYVLWEAKGLKQYGFKIIHQTKCDDNSLSQSLELEQLIGVNGMTYLLSMLSPGPLISKSEGLEDIRVRDINEFVDFFRRLQVPFYEEARRHFDKPEMNSDYQGANEMYPYFPEELERIAKKYSQS